MENTFENAVKKVVKFWSEKSFNTPLNQNNGDDSESGGLAFILKNLVASDAQSDVSPDNIEKFETKLTELLYKQKDNRYKLDLDVDYHPCSVLSEAVDFAGLNEMCLPCKTWTTINMQTFEAKASYQYRGKLTVL